MHDSVTCTVLERDGAWRACPWQPQPSASQWAPVRARVAVDIDVAFASRAGHAAIEHAGGDSLYGLALSPDSVSATVASFEAAVGSAAVEINGVLVSGSDKSLASTTRDGGFNVCVVLP